MSSLAQSAVLAARGSESALLSVLVDRVHDPVDLRVVADDWMAWVHKNDFVVPGHTKSTIFEARERLVSLVGGI